MKVIQINGNAYRGSTGKIVRQLHDMLKSNGDECIVVCSGNKEIPLDEDTVALSNRIGVKVHQVFSVLSGQAGFNSKKTTQRLIKILETEKPDIVHLHHLEGYFLDVQMLTKYLKENKVNTVWTIHDCWPFTGHCTHFTVAGCDKWKTECNSCPQKRSYPYSALFDNSKNLYGIKKSLF